MAPRRRTYRDVDLPRPPSQAVLPEPDGRILVTLVDGSEMIRLKLGRDVAWRLAACLIETLRELD
jgi:hypothetical protein